MIHWLVPEKLKYLSTEKNSDDNEIQEVSYTIQYEILVLKCFFGNLTFKENHMKI